MKIKRKNLERQFKLALECETVKLKNQLLQAMKDKEDFRLRGNELWRDNAAWKAKHEAVSHLLTVERAVSAKLRDELKKFEPVPTIVPFDDSDY